ncbi:uncharacterized protein LOC126998624 [Eriocheir sinensis]|uniref:uncharacterized protein LOC126998624 n=1 Tax=Eriocheir sinensis TaxID=95602 RepID=UPI0021C99FFE|nr:uncharacterized protein LOC126998624 [Eriocheir sinensis]
MAKDECQEDMVYTYDMNLSELQYIQPSDETIVLEGPKDRIIFLVAAGAAASFILIAVALLFVFTYQTKKYRRISGEPQRPTPVTGREVAPSPRPAVLLVYTPNLHPQMAALAARLKEMTGLQIEDLNDVGDQDKLNDPTVWVTRRLMDANTRFVLPCSTVHHDSEELEEGGAVHFLLDHFLQYLRSSRLAYDYTRLHLIRLEDEPHVEVRDVTPGRVYRLPADLPQMAHNLTLATPTTSTSPQGTLEEACET